MDTKRKNGLDRSCTKMGRENMKEWERFHDWTRVCAVFDRLFSKSKIGGSGLQADLEQLQFSINQAQGNLQSTSLIPGTDFDACVLLYLKTFVFLVHFFFFFFFFQESVVLFLLLAFLNNEKRGQLSVFQINFFPNGV